ncbi:MAG: amino acid-binding protein [Halobacteriaceae archaeon]
MDTLGAVLEKFDASPGKRRVVELLLRRGYAVDEEGRVVSDGIEIPYKHIQDEIGVDRRVVKSTTEAILADDELRAVFQNLSSISFLREAAPELGLSVISVGVADAAEPGLLAELTAVFAEHEVVLRQCVAEDPFFSAEPGFTAIVDGEVPGALLTDLSALPFVTDVSLSTGAALEGEP